MTMTLLVITDGRQDCLSQTLNSFAQKVTGQITHSLLIDDSANPDYAEWINSNYGQWFDAVIHHKARRGFAGALQSGWSNLPKSDWVFGLEDDFTFNQAVDLEDIADVLTSHPYLAQMVLKRQPWNDAEKAAGDIISVDPRSYQDRHVGDAHWLEHCRNFSTNPSLYPYYIAQLGFPQEPSNNERLFSDKLSEMGFRYGYWGRREDAPRVTHIGAQRIGTGY